MTKIKKWGLAVLCSAAALISSVFLFAKPVEMQVKAEEGTQSVLEMENGASLKINSEGGLRFRVKMNEIEKNYIVGNDDISLHFLIAPKDLFDKVSYTDGEWDFYNKLSQKLIIPVDENKIYQEGDYYWANGCIVSIKESNRERDFMAIAYTYDRATGERTYATIRIDETTYDVKDESFSLNYVRGDLYDVVNQSVLYTANNTDYSNSVFNCSAYNQWFGTADYNILIDSIADYKNLTAKINNELLVNNFKGKCFTIENGVLEDPEYDSIENKPTFHSITMNNGEELYHEYLLLNGSTISMPKNPTKEDGEQHTYKFNSWVNVNTEVAYDFSTIVNSDMTLDASYEAIVDRDAVILWSASTAETVLQDVSIENYASVKKEAKINVSAARNESEGAQIFLTADADIESYDVEVWNLTTKEGTVFSSANIEVYSYKYIYVSDNVASHRGFGTGWYPDAIMPFATTKAYQENTIQTGQNQGVYIRFDIPADCQDGVYTGSIRVTYDGVVEYVPVTLTVWDITVSEQNNLNSLFAIGWNWVEGESDNSQAQYNEYIKLLNEYRLSPIYLMINNDAEAVKDENYWNTYANVVYQYVINPNHASYALNYIEDRSGTIPTFNTEEFSKMLIELAEKSFATNVNVLDKAFVYFATLLDEATMQGKYDQTQKVTDDLRAVRNSIAATIRARKQIYVESYGVTEAFVEDMAKAVEKVPHVFVSNYDESYAPLINQDGTGTGVWCPNLWEFQEASNVDQYVNTLGIDWWYGCSGSDTSIPSYQLDDYTLSPRLMSWQQMYYGITGNFYWGVDNYKNFVGDYYNQDANVEGINGDGWLVYPGAPYGLDGPVATRRLEAIRDGMEEYEMLLSLKNRYAALSGSNDAFDSMYAFLTKDLFSGIEIDATAETFARARNMAAQLLMLANSNAEVYVRNLEVKKVFIREKLVGEIFVKNGYTLNCNAGSMSTESVAGGTIYSFSWNLSDFNEATFEVSGLAKNNKFTIYNNGLTIGSYKAETLVGEQITIPTHNTADITATFNGVGVDVSSGKYTATEAGILLVTYTASGYEPITIQIDVREFAHIVSGEEVSYTASADVKEATIDEFFADFGEYAGATFSNVIAFNDTASHTVQLDASLMSVLKQYNYVALKFLINDNGWGVSVTANGETYKLVGNRKVYSLSIKTAGWDGTLTFRAYHFETWAHPHDYKIYITDIFAGYMEEIVVEEFDSRVSLGNTVVIPEASVVFASASRAKDIVVSATFNGEPVDVSFGEYLPLSGGKLVVTYSAEGVDGVTIEIAVVDYIELVTKDDLMDKIVSSSCSSGTAQVGNVSGAQYASEAMYAIKLPEDPNGVYGGASVTVDINVGDMNGYSKLEMNFWAVGVGGDTWYLSAGEQQLFTAQGWRGYDAPVTVEIPVSLVQNGILSLTFTQTWATGDELYIQSIVGYVSTRFEGVFPDSLVLGTEVKADDYLVDCYLGDAIIAEDIPAISARFNGEAVGLPFVPITTGTLTLTYEYQGASKSFEIEIIDEQMLVTKDNLISKTTLVSGAAMIGNASGAQLGSEAGYCIKLFADYTNYSATIDIAVGDVSSFGKLEMQFWALGVSGDTWTLSLGDGTVLYTQAGWRSHDNPVTVEIPVSAVVDGKLRLTFTETWATGDELYIQYIKGIVAPQLKAEVPDTLLLGSRIDSTDYTAELILGDAVLEDGIRITSAMLNGEAISLPSIITATGTLTLTYEYQGASKSFEIEIIDEQMLVTKDNLISKTTLVSGAAMIGNASGAQLGSEAGYCIKLFADYTNYSATIDIAVGDVSSFGKLEMQFWALGINGDTWTLSLGDGTVLYMQAGWRSHDNPVTVEIPVSAVVDGKLRLTFTETWATGDELYIQYIKGIVTPQLKAEVPDTLLLGSRIDSTDYTAELILGDAVLEDGIRITSAMLNGEAISLPSIITATGTLTLTYEYQGASKSFEIEIIDEQMLVTKDNLISKTTLVSGAAMIGNASGAQLGSEAGYCIKLFADYTNYSVTIDIAVGDVSGFSKLEMQFWALGVDGDTWTLSLGDGTVLYTQAGWRSHDNPVTVEIPVSAVVDGKLRLTFTETWATGDELYIQYIKGIVAPQLKAEVPDTLLLGSRIDSTDYTAELILGDAVLEDGIRITSAMLNGEAISLPSIITATGTLTLTYEYQGASKSFEIEIIDEQMLVTKDNLISKTTLVSGAAMIGNASGAQLGSEAGYCIKLFADYTNYSATIDIAVGDVSGFSKLEMQFWALGVGGDTWTLSLGDGTVLYTQAGWRSHDNPVTVEIPVSAVVDGKLRLTFTETWATGDELYIQYIKGIVAPQLKAEVPDTLLLGSRIDSTDYTAELILGDVVLEDGIRITSAMLNGEAISLPSIITATGTLTLTYEYQGASKSFEIEIIDEQMLVTKDNLISKTTLVSGAATIGNVSNAQHASEAAYCIQLPADYTNYSVTIDIAVGDVSGFSKLEMQFWALGVGGDTWTLSLGDGTVLYTQAGWRSHDNPVTVEIPVSAVVDGKLRLTFTETWATGDELYIQYIKGIAEVLPKTLVTKDDLISKITLVSGAATIGNVSNAQHASEAAYCIQLPADYTNYSVTIDIAVGDVSGFSKIEMQFWALGVGGDTWTLSLGDGTVLYSQAGWRSHDNPVTVEIPVSAVVDGKLRLTFTETWATADELYIQYIKAIA